MKSDSAAERKVGDTAENAQASNGVVSPRIVETTSSGNISNPAVEAAAAADDDEDDLPI